MKYIFNFPDIGEGLEEGIIVEWKVKVGQKIESGDNLVLMETDKVVADIPSPKSGTLVKLFGEIGDVINVGSALVEIEIEGTASAEDTKIEVVEEEGAGVVGTLEIASHNAVMKASTEGVASESNNVKTGTTKKVLATPVARAMAKDLDVDINTVSGTGPGGRVMKEDIKACSQKRSTPEVSTPQRKVSSDNLVDIEPITQIRKAIAKNMINSKRNAAHMSIFDDAEVSELDRVRKSFKESLAAEGIKLTYLAFIIKATALSLKSFRSLNSEMDLEGGKIMYKKYYNIGIAVDTEKGLVVPVIKNADKLSIKEIALQIQLISAKATENKLTMDDMKDGTFTITSYGSIGGKYAVPVINFPQTGILGIGKITKQPIVKNDELAIGLVMPMSLSVDHRVVDGGETARFLNTVMAYLSDPLTMLMG